MKEINKTFKWKLNKLKKIISFPDIIIEKLLIFLRQKIFKQKCKKVQQIIIGKILEKFSKTKNQEKKVQ